MPMKKTMERSSASALTIGTMVTQSNARRATNGTTWNAITQKRQIDPTRHKHTTASTVSLEKSMLDGQAHYKEKSTTINSGTMALSGLYPKQAGRRPKNHHRWRLLSTDGRQTSMPTYTDENGRVQARVISHLQPKDQRQATVPPMRLPVLVVGGTER